MNLFLQPLTMGDCEDLYTFERENRLFFEQSVPSRGDDYYHPEMFKTIHKSLLEEQFQGQSYFYLIKDKEDDILGRINLVEIDYFLKEGALGYRVGKRSIGKGVATKALHLLLQNVRDLGIEKILAKTTSTNIASQKILEKNNFRLVGKSDESFEMNGGNIFFVYYEWE